MIIDREELNKKPPDFDGTPKGYVFDVMHMTYRKLSFRERILWNIVKLVYNVKNLKPNIISDISSIKMNLQERRKSHNEIQ